LVRVFGICFFVPIGFWYYIFANCRLRFARWPSYFLRWLRCVLFLLFEIGN
jgi:hypothetical protein